MTAPASEISSYQMFFFLVLFPSLSLSPSLPLYSQSQAVSDGGKCEQPTCTLTILYISHFYKLKHVCARQKQISDSVSFLVMLFFADKWVCLCLDVFVELNMSARGCGGSSFSLPGTPGGEAGPANSVMSWAVSFEKLLEDPCGVSHFTVRHAQHTGSGIIQVLMSSSDLSGGVPYMFIHSVCVFLHRPS